MNKMFGEGVWTPEQRDMARALQVDTTVAKETLAHSGAGTSKTAKGVSATESAISQQKTAEIQESKKAAVT